MSHHEIREQILDWTGGHVDFTDEQMDAMVAAWEQVLDLYPDADDQDERDAALSGALQIILGEATLSEVAAPASEAAIFRARAARAGAIIASAGTDTEERLAERAHTTRMTVRRALGKGRPQA